MTGWSPSLDDLLACIVPRKFRPVALRSFPMRSVNIRQEKSGCDPVKFWVQQLPKPTVILIPFRSVGAVPRRPEHATVVLYAPVEKGGLVSDTKVLHVSPLYRGKIKAGLPRNPCYMSILVGVPLPSSVAAMTLIECNLPCFSSRVPGH